MSASDLVLLPLNHPQIAPKLSVIVVPDFAKDGTAPEKTKAWIDSMMPPDGSQAQVFRFEYQITLRGHSIWRQISDKGEELLRDFYRKVGMHQVLEKPIIFIGYGLGGLIIKRALSVLSDPTVQRYSKDTLNLVAGVIFFGTPHTKMKQPEKWCRLTPLLSLVGRLPKPFLVQSEMEANVAAVMCEDFEQSGLESTVLTIYEIKPTKVKLARRILKDSVTLVDKAFAETWAKKEKLLGNNVSHEDVGVFYPASPIQQEIGLLLMSALSMLRQDMTASMIQAAEQMDLWEESISQVSMNRTYPKAAILHSSGTGRHDSSEDANFGSSLPSDFDVIPSNDEGEYIEDEALSHKWPCYVWGGFEEKRDFVGREDTFKAIDECFFAPASSNGIPSAVDTQELPCCCISGLGGMGKTQTATQYAVARRAKFDAIFVIQAENTAKLSECFSKIAPALGLLHDTDRSEQGNDEADLVVNRNKALKWLSHPKFSTAVLRQRTEVLGDLADREPNWLLIFDNAESSTTLRDYLPVSSVGCILVTTRDARTSNYLRSQSHVTHIYLDKLGTVPASKLFLQLSFKDPSETNRKNASVIVDKLGGLPLAIEQVAAYIHSIGMTLEEFLDLYDKTLQERPKSATGNHAWSYEIVASWALGSLSAAAGSLLRVYSYLDPDGMKDSILTDLFAKGRVRNLPQDYPDDRLLHIDARGELLQSSLIRVTIDTDPVTIKMHRLVQDISVARMATSQRNHVFSFVVEVIFDAWPFTENNWDHQAGLWSTQEALLRHIFRLQHIARAHDVSAIALELKRKFITLLSSGGWYRQERGDFDSGIPLFELGVRMCEDSSGEFLDLRADLSFGLGGATCDTNKWPEFLVHAQDQLHYRLRSDFTKGIPPTSNTAIAYSELGLAQALMKQYEKGVRNCDKAIQLYAKQPDVVDGSFFPAFPHIHRALALVGAGRPQEGEQGLLDLIGWHDTHSGLGQPDFKLGYAWQCCGLIYARTGRPNVSVASYYRALSNYRATVGSLYHRTGNVCGKIAEHYELLDQYEAADYFFNEAEKAYTSQPHYKPELCRHFFILSQSLRDRGDAEAAKSTLEKAEALYADIEPSAEPAVLSLELLNAIVAPWVW